MRAFAAVLVLAAVLGALAPATVRGGRLQPEPGTPTAADAGQASPGELLVRVDPAVGALAERFMIGAGGRE